MSCEQQDRSQRATAIPHVTPTPPPADVLRKLTWEGREGMREAEVPLAQLDSAVVFGNDYPEPIRYDAARGALRYRGPMSHASFVHLSGLSRERHYQRALEQLFVASAMPPEPAAKSWGKKLVWPAVGTAALVVLGGGWWMIGGRQPDAAPAPPIEQGAASLANAQAEGENLSAATQAASDVKPAPGDSASRER